MIPITLKFQAFGPYVNKQEVDFKKFADSGIFLIHGATGSGKTTILDAISYALYGKSSGGQRGDITSMRCQTASEHIPTEVEFIFKIADKTYKFTRSIAVKTRRNGSKHYNVTQNALFLNSEDIFVPFFENPKIRETEQKACELIGLSHEQFVQVIMLPQGKFEKFLMAKSDEKEEILVTLFNAGKWQEVAEWICDQAKETARDITSKKNNINTLLKSENAENIDDLNVQINELTKSVNSAAEIINKKSNQLSAEKDKLTLQSEIFNLFEEMLRTEKELAKIKEQENEINELMAKIENGRKALNVSQKYSTVMNLYKLMQAANLKLAKEKENNSIYKSTVEKIDKELCELKKNEQTIEKLKENKIKSEALVTIYKEITKSQISSERENKKFEALKKENTEKQDIYNSIREKLKQQKELKDHIFNTYSMKLPELKAKSEKFAMLEKKSHELSLLDKNINTTDSQLIMLNKQLGKFKELITLKKQEYESVYSSYIKGTAYLLSESLKEGNECPVCGSVHHPKKAVNTNSSIDATTVKMLSTELDELNEKFNATINAITKQDAIKLSAVESLEKLQQENNEIKKALGEDSKEEILAQLRKAEKESNRLNDIIRLETDLSEKVNNTENELNQLSLQLNEQSRLKEEAAAIFSSMNSQKISGIETETELLKKINSYKLSIERYVNELEALTNKKIAADKLLSSSNTSLSFLKEDFENKDIEYVKEKNEYYSLLKENGFADTSEFKKFLVPQEQIGEWDKKAQAYIIEKGSVAKNLERLVKLTEGKEKPDIEQIKNSIAALENTIKEYDKQIALQADKKERINKTIQQTEKNQKILQEMMRKYDMYYNFGTTLRGDRGISLRRYVLGVMLSSVTSEANRLLKNVHDGRYQLCRTLEGSGRTRKAGLELEVYDAYSGEKRSVTGLSGGEKFLVSLALSLGLSAVVQAQSGGIRIDTMFIDEGFGSLDSSSIGDAMNILSSVKGSKRLVGIISHVQMLKETIESSISVEKSRKGSTLIVNG